MGVPVLERAGEHFLATVEGEFDILVAAAVRPGTVRLQDEVAAVQHGVIVDQSRGSVAHSPAAVVSHRLRLQPAHGGGRGMSIVTPMMLRITVESPPNCPLA